MAWEIDDDETRQFQNAFERARDYFEKHIRRQRKRPPKNYDISKYEEKLKEPFLCPDRFPNILRRFGHKRPRAVQNET